MLIDSHCHLDPEYFQDDLEEVIQRALDNGITYMLTISTKLSTFPGVLKTAQASPNLFCTLGVHPHEAESEPTLTKDLLVNLSHESKVVGLGETGLDYYYDHSPRDLQRKAFIAHIEASLETDLPLIVHTREAEANTIDLIKTVGQGRARGVIHCFSGSKELAHKALDLGFYISFSGIVTFKKAQEIQEVAASTPLDRLLVETDAPYLAPIPHRGQRNEPAHVRLVAQKVADLRGISLDDVAQATTTNFFALFGKAQYFLRKNV